jgi:hypothetical protein
LASLQGDHAEASALIEAAIRHAEANGQGTSAKFAHWSAAVLYNGLARYEEALAAAREATANAIDPWQSMWPLPELVEAAARTGDLRLARDALERLAQTTQPAGTDFALGIEARSRALVSDGAAAEALHREAIERLSRTRLRPELARAHLLFGEWLRRQGRTADAREPLRAAEEMFAAIGMAAFAGRVRAELLAAGAKVRRHPAEAREELTPQEDQIPSSTNTLCRWYSTVRGLMKRRAPISRFDSPSRARRAIWASWEVRPALVPRRGCAEASPAATSSRSARPTNASMPMVRSISRAVRSSSRACLRRCARTSHSP